MSISSGVAFLVAATILMKFFALCLLMAPWSMDSRGALVLTIGAAGVALALMAARHFRMIHRHLHHAAPSAG